MNNISNLPRDMVEEILCRIPLTSIRAVRSTCRKWRSLLKDESFTNKYRLAQEAASRADGEITSIALINFELYLMSFDLHGIYNSKSDDPPLFVKPEGKLISLNDTYPLDDIIEICYCDGLLLFTTRECSRRSRLIVWNPYTGQTRWFWENDLGIWDAYALGYDKSTHKILRFMVDGDKYIHNILDLKFKSWRYLDVSPDCWIKYTSQGLSLKGNMYWYGRVQPSNGDLRAATHGFLVSFDFTKEIFGPHLPLPFAACYNDVVILSSLREEQLAVLFHRSDDNLEMEIWVTTNIEPDAVSWSKFFAIDMKPLTGFKFSGFSTFLIDEEKRVVVVFDTDNDVSSTHDPSIACFIGENGYFKKVNLEKQISGMFDIDYPRVCSYVPNSVRIK